MVSLCFFSGGIVGKYKVFICIHNCFLRFTLVLSTDVEKNFIIEQVKICWSLYGPILQGITFNFMNVLPQLWELNSLQVSSRNSNKNLKYEQSTYELFVVC